MIQIIAQRGGFVLPLPNQPIHLHNITSVFTHLADTLAKLPVDEHYNLFYTLAHHSGADTSPTPQRTYATFSHQTVLAWDLDTTDQTRALEYAAHLASILDIASQSITVVNSGNGVHLLVNLKTPIRDVGYFKKNKLAYGEVCFKLNTLIRESGLTVDKVDTSIFEPARVLRLPSTINKKSNKPDSPCELIQLATAVLEIDLFKISGLKEAGEENVSPEDIRRHYPHPDFEAMFTGCQFMQWAVNHPNEVHEPHAFDLFSLLSTVQPASKVKVGEVEYDPQSLGRRVFDGASASASLAGAVFEDKWAQSKRYGSRTCETINTRWGGCSDCPHFAKIPTPLALKGPEHIGSDANGYWVYDKKGKRTHPNYSDIEKLYIRKNSYITGMGERMLVFDRTHYVPVEPLRVKAWVDQTVVPNDDVREMHRNEFLARIKVTGSIGQKAEEHLFNESIKGKLNCRNGMLDIVTGQFLPHTPTVGFQYVLPYDYTANLTSEFFLDWLDQVTMSRVEFIESLLDIMAYCLWPSFDDHLFTYFVGEGANGKSTLLNVIGAMVGELNYSAINIDQLTRNRFQPANLEGKLVNLCEEASGSDLDSEQLNTLKNMSAGGKMSAERKNQQGYKFHNQAKLIFSANRVPKFHEGGESIKRRLVVIPFDHMITKKDPSVEDRLKSEVPAILSMLVRRIQTKINDNDGKFFVARDSQEHLKAQTAFLTAGNPIMDWAKEEIEVTTSPNDIVHISDCYVKFKQWSEVSGIKHTVNIYSFGRVLTNFIFTRADGSFSTTHHGHRTRAYKFAKFSNQEGVASHDRI